MRIIRIQDITGTGILAGAVRGQDLFAKLLLEVQKEPVAPEPVFLDFAEVEIATASFLRESILMFRSVVRSRRSTLYPVLANINETILDELLELAKVRGEAWIACDLSIDGKVIRAKLIGTLDPKQRLAFDEVLLRGETDASELMREFKDRETVGPTAWNNRLSSLASLGVVMEINQGRTKRYKPILSEVR